MLFIRSNYNESVMLLKNWWKILGVLLLVYVLLAGLIIPLGSGISDVPQPKLYAGKTSAVEVVTYNTTYASELPQDIQARIRINPTQVLSADSVEVLSDKRLRLFFEVPAGRLPIDATSRMANRKPSHPILEIYSPKNGRLLLQSAVVFVENEAQPQAIDEQLLETLDAYPSSEGVAFPFLNVLEETIRNLYFHVPMWFGMMGLLALSVFFSIQHLRKPTKAIYDIKARSFATAGVVFGLLGVFTGALWALYTWGAPWSFDVKQNSSAVALLIYLAYFVLRSSFDDTDKRARVAAIYNIFAFATLIPLLYVLPRLSESLHPGMGGNPAFKSYDLDSTMRLVFYPSIIAWFIMGYWLARLQVRTAVLEERIESQGLA